MTKKVFTLDNKVYQINDNVVELVELEVERYEYLYKMKREHMELYIQRKTPVNGSSIEEGRIYDISTAALNYKQVSKL